ncbi:MAG: HAMP domain-containing sensor histidine kinase [Candidatus Neomarinimicrobiota bacterium]
MNSKTCLLKDQLIQYFGDLKNVPEEFGCFLTAVNKVYIQSNIEKKILKQTLVNQSKELSRANLELTYLGRMLPDMVIRLNSEGKILEIKTRKMYCYYSTSSPFLGQNILEMPLGQLNKNFKKALKNLNKTSQVAMFDIILDQNKRDLFQACLLFLSPNQIIVFIRSKRGAAEETDWAGTIFKTGEKFHNFSFIKEKAAEQMYEMNSGTAGMNILDKEKIIEPLGSRSHFGDMDFFFPYFSGNIVTRNNFLTNRQASHSNKMSKAAADRIFPREKNGFYFSNFISGNRKISHEGQLKRNPEILNAPEKAEKIKRLFLAKVSHEIRTPLNAILGFSQLIEMRIGPLMGKEEIDFMRIIGKSSERLMRTIHELLEMSELESGSYVKKNENMDLCNLVNDLISEFSLKAQEKDIQLIYNHGIKTACIFADNYGISLALENIIDNAVKFTNQGIVTIDLGLKSG